MFSWINSNSVKYVAALTAVGRSELLARWPGTHSRVLSGIQRAAQTVLGVYLKRTCSRETGASGAFPTPFDPGELYHDSYTCKISILKVQKLQRKDERADTTDRITLPNNTVGNNAMLPDTAYGVDAASCQITMAVCFVFYMHVRSMPMPLYAS